MATKQLQLAIAVNMIYYRKYSLNAVFANTSAKMEDVCKLQASVSADVTRV